MPTTIYFRPALQSHNVKKSVMQTVEASNFYHILTISANI